MMPPDGPSVLPETGLIEASPVSDGCVPKPEDCTNGVDDDCDGLTDCADPQCTTMGFQCAPPWPSGWTPVALYDSYTATGYPAIPPCSSDPAYGNLLAFSYYTPIPTAASCTFTCGNIDLTGATCSDPVLTTASSGCPSAPATSCTTNNVSVASIGTTCTNYSACQGGINGVNIATSSSYTGGATCGAPSTTKTIPTWDSTKGWAGAGRVCGPTNPPSTHSGAAAGCSTGEYCLKVPANGLACITSPGQQACPASSLYSSEHKYNSTGTDARSCDFSSATCTPSGTTCSESVSVYNNSGCTGMPAILTNAKTCYSGTPLNYVTAESAQATLTPSGGTCAQGGAGVVTGSITPGGTQTTVCCVP
jgi:hypothetical protein